FHAIVVTGPVVVAPRTDPSVHHPRALLGNVTESRLGIATWNEALSEASRCVTCPDPTCVRGCPAHNDIPAFIGALREGRLDAAHRILGRTSVLPDICARVCDQ